MAIRTMTFREDEVLKRTIEVLKRYLDPDRIILFGSRAKQNFSKNSDFDLAVDKKRVDIRLERKIREDIEKVSGLYGVDIIFLNSVDQIFKKMVLKTGKVIYERDS
ncbi:MAG: nucleotidyltransferase domain-containing protein [Candidatus Aminicenantia bacterium]